MLSAGNLAELPSRGCLDFLTVRCLGPKNEPPKRTRPWKALREVVTRQPGLERKERSPTPTPVTERDVKVPLTSTWDGLDCCSSFWRVSFATRTSDVAKR